MSLPDLLQWLAGAEKTGTLRVEQGRGLKIIRVRAGVVTGCSSDDPSLRLGQFLLSRKKITEEQLRRALTQQEESSAFLGQVLVEMKVLTSDEVREELEAKAKEVIYSLFDWTEATFRFEDEEVDDCPEGFPVDLRVEDVLLRGLQRMDDLSMIRELLYDPRLILRYTSKPPGPEIFGDDSSRSMYSAIDGTRTLADILMHVHGTEYIVKRFLFDLHQDGYIEIAGLQTPDDEAAPIEEPLSLAPLEIDVQALQDPAPPEELSEPLTPDAKPTSKLTSPEPEATAVSECSQGDARRGTVADASELMAQGDVEGALDILDRLYRKNPGDDALRRLTAEAEAAFVGKAYRHYLPADKVPILRSSLESMSSQSLTPQEFFLLSRIDGAWDVKSIIQVAPFEEVLALRTLKRLHEMEMIELLDPV